MAKTVVIKIGSQVLANAAGDIDVVCVQALAQQLKHIQLHGYNVVAVVSGAVHFGRKVFAAKQAAAAIGQVKLLQMFGEVGQVLLRRGDLSSARVRENMRLTIGEFWGQGLMVLINENDAVELNSFGGNDYLALAMARVVNADVVVLLSTVDGLVDNQGHLVQRLETVSASIEKWVDDTAACGVGGMAAKLKVAQACLREGRTMIIVNGKQHNILQRLLLESEPVGTVFSRRRDV